MSNTLNITRKKGEEESAAFDIATIDRLKNIQKMDADIKGLLLM